MKDDNSCDGSAKALLEAVGKELAKSVSAPARAAGAAIAKRYPGSAVLFYGAAADDPDGEAARGNALYDFYIIAPSYRGAYEQKRLRVLNRLLPPNVFYFETPYEDVILRAKYAVLSAGHFERLCGAKTFHSYFWGRFAQPSRIIHAPDAMRAQIERSIAAAVATFCRRAAGLTFDEFTPHDLWRAGLRASYRSELRAEKTDRAETVLARYDGWPERVTAPALAASGLAVATAGDGRLLVSPKPARLPVQTAWIARSVFGGFLSAARLLKATTTFHGGLEYILWKIERHAGVRLQATDWQRRHPMLAAPGLALRYYIERAKTARKRGA
ncbi:MAG: hypothetical protein ACE5FO_10785 [Parvularculaceae bacterium]